MKQYTFFFHLTSPFSNFHPAVFVCDGRTFVANEQFMMYSKAVTFGDMESASKVLNATNNSLAQKLVQGELSSEDIVSNKSLADEWNQIMMSVKKLGRGVKNYDDSVWGAARVGIVKKGALCKFSQNESLRQKLLATKGTFLVESSKFDKIWGNGLWEQDSKKISEDKWPGLNLLGKLLDEVRDELTN